jgi:hypothetical protein
MPKQHFMINKFNKGMICNVDSADIDKEAAFYCRDVNLLGQEARLIGVPGDTDMTVTSANYGVGWIQGHGFVTKTDGKRTLFFYDFTNSKIKYVEDFYGTPGAITDLATFVITDTPGGYSPPIVYNQSVRFGVGTGSPPYWCGYTSNVIDGGTPVTTPIFSIGSPEIYLGTSGGYFSVTSVATPTTGTDGQFLTTKKYYWKIALEFDGYQIGVLDTASASSGVNFIVPVAQTRSYAVTLKAKNGSSAPTDFNKRITAVLLFRAEGFTNQTTPSTQYRLVQRVTVDDTAWAVSGNDLIYTITDDFIEGYTFNTYSGLPQSATVSSLSWSVACVVDKYVFAGNCGTSIGIDEAQWMIFRSVAGRPDVFDYMSATPSFIKMPSIPLAMAEFNGRLISFDANTLYVINPDTLGFEQIINGYGCNHPQSVCRTQYGLAFGNKNGIFLFDGAKVTRISYPIDRVGQESPVYTFSGGAVTVARSTAYDLGYTLNTYMTSTNPIKLVYHMDLDMLIIGIGYSTTDAYFWGYCFATNSWTALSSPSTIITTGTEKFSFIVGKDSEVYIACKINSGSADKLYKFLAVVSSRKATWQWGSQRLPFNEGDESQYQKVYTIDNVQSGGAIIRYGVDSATVNTALTTIGTNADCIAAASRRCKYLRFAISGVSANDYVDMISILYRTMEGVR